MDALHAARTKLRFIIGDGSLVLIMLSATISQIAKCRRLRLEFSELGRMQIDAIRSQDPEREREEMAREEEFNSEVREMNLELLDGYELTEDGKTVSLGENWRDVIREAGYLEEATGWRILTQCCFRDDLGTRPGREGSQRHQAGRGNGEGSGPSGGSDLPVGEVALSG